MVIFYSAEFVELTLNYMGHCPKFCVNVNRIQL